MLKIIDFFALLLYTIFIMSEQMKMKLWKKITIISLSAVLGLCLIFACFIGYFRLPVNAYYKASEKMFVIPETNSGYIAQGLCFDNSSNSFILSGYMKDKSPSPLYAVSGEGKYLKKVTLLTDDGKDYKGHGGGVATYGNFIYVADGGENCLYVYSLSEFNQANEGDKLKCKGTISLEINDQDYLSPAFVTVYKSKLIVGEFYRDKKYPTPESHKITTKAGDYNQALALEFSLSSGYNLGVSSAPTKAYSLPDQVQGLALYDDKIYLSTSWGLSFSHILEYDENKLVKQKDITLLGHNLSLYSLDSASLLNDYKLPPMSEEITFVNGKLFVNCESASDKYIFGKLTGGKYLYATDLTKMGK